MTNTIITIGREFGSGGHEIAEKLAKHYDYIREYGVDMPEVVNFKWEDRID